MEYVLNGGLLMILHPIEPVFDCCSKILILGSFPSVRSREVNFFYGHPQNRFWKVLSHVTCSPLPQSVDEKRDLLHSKHIALWDVLSSCDITGSSDSSIRNAIPNDLSRILDAADIRQIYVNGKTAEKFYNKYLRDSVGRAAVCLPSTSPANASWSLERLCGAWQIICLDL